MDEQRYTGTVTKVVTNNFGFIGHSTIRKTGPVGIELIGRSPPGDVFVHTDDCTGISKLEIGMELSFATGWDKTRTGGRRAIEVVLAGRITTASHALVRATNTADLTQDVHPFRKASGESTNDPAWDRVDPEDVDAFLCGLLRDMFPDLAAIELDYTLVEDPVVDRYVGDMVFFYRTAVSDRFANALLETYTRYQTVQCMFRWMRDEGWFSPGANISLDTVRSVLRVVLLEKDAHTQRVLFNNIWATLQYMQSHQLLGCDTVLPIRHFVDLFLRLPICYYEGHIGYSVDSSVDQPTKFMCNLIKGPRWTPLYRLFNTYARSIKAYNGKLIPPRILQAMHDAYKDRMFDCIVLMTQELKQAGPHWTSPSWDKPQPMNMAVVAFKRDVPVMFVLAMTPNPMGSPTEASAADTVRFLSMNAGAPLNGFDSIAERLWPFTGGSRRSAFLREQIALLERAYKAGIACEYVNGTAQAPPAS